MKAAKAEKAAEKAAARAEEKARKRNERDRREAEEAGVSAPMYLKSLVLKGFKSFADRSVLSLEPGITAIVGPNGSGKSNISDAVLWVLGERNAKHLRGQAMEDVIFAGSSARKATGLAEVDLVLDNSRRHAAHRLQRGGHHRAACTDRAKAST